MSTGFKPNFLAYAGSAFSLALVQWIGIELTPRLLITCGLVAAVIGIAREVWRP